MPQIMPIRDLKDTAMISKKCNSIDEPIFITKNGYGDMVLMSVKVYEETIARLQVEKLVNDSLSDVKNGASMIDGDEFFSSVKKRLEK